MEEQVNEAHLVLKNNSRVIGELSKAYGSLLDARGAAVPVVDESIFAIEEFQRQLAGTVQDLIMHQSRLEALLKMCADRKSLLQGALQFRSMQLSRALAERTHHSTINMEGVTVQMHRIARKTLVETVSMRIITVVTLLFLPGTFISFPDGATRFSQQNIGTGALKLYLLVSLPLMCLTLVAWAIMYVREKNRTKEDIHDVRMIEAGEGFSIPTTSTTKGR
ncbi:uncharacterized protein MYCFIDRAFT_83727 [Pseudocercospora fijiensis CIRAD86]|uniref:Uncharacterized protein n=1 Tax=Pseudocercospora fijiensis (strain CIRAD86) TaxID=383855 RepID=M3AN87_PSEFD|nr:uncharacterized protein MYCFIDRAFT_83727 [Pseudocercospora fijiensis CIRAD86]EME78932.1 hypothetical protein MYCFIDRAFT_83727 [Pseudocercospora fijiensis CIRAD86]